MTTGLSGLPSRRASPLRFLLSCLGGWALLRVVMAGNQVILPSPFDVVSSPIGLAPVARGPATVLAVQERSGSDRAIETPMGHWQISRPMLPAAAVRGMGSGGKDREARGVDRHSLHRMPTVPHFPSSGRGVAALPPWEDGWAMPAVGGAEPATDKPFWMRRQMAGWSLGSWLHMREASASVPGGIGAVSQLGGSQGGMRIAYGFGETGRLRAYGRATLAIQRPRQREVAYGMAFAPLARWPVDVAVERRLAVGPEGRNAMAAMVTGGVSGVALRGDFRLDAYGQAGVVGMRQRDGFADGAVVIDRRIGPDESARLRIGALVAGAVQPGAARVDVGPRLTLRLPDVGEGSRIALDWRQRIAGDAAPESGVALTLAADF